jgi:hypothetical protein
MKHLKSSQSNRRSQVKTSQKLLLNITKSCCNISKSIKISQKSWLQHHEIITATWRGSTGVVDSSSSIVKSSIRATKLEREPLRPPETRSPWLCPVLTCHKLRSELLLRSLSELSRHDRRLELLLRGRPADAIAGGRRSPGEEGFHPHA